MKSMKGQSESLALEILGDYPALIGQRKKTKEGRWR